MRTIYIVERVVNNLMDNCGYCEENKTVTFENSFENLNEAYQYAYNRPDENVVDEIDGIGYTTHIIKYKIYAICDNNKVLIEPK